MFLKMLYFFFICNVISFCERKRLQPLNRLQHTFCVWRCQFLIFVQIPLLTCFALANDVWVNVFLDTGEDFFLRYRMWIQTLYWIKILRCNISTQSFKWINLNIIEQILFHYHKSFLFFLFVYFLFIFIFVIFLDG